ncbi:MAG: hypothetical protein MUC43_08185 [Pirellula sp.]|jgi:hypothetical protein|nr:hypothetical protein [Pirellula sp.]
MRLTLRTLLAYRDGVLDNKDAILLESKLRDSVTAQQISRRIDEGMSNPRLAPIPVDAKEFGFDPNHIAEYLDDTIPLDQIPAMERCCLENNALLSEVGSCHRILTKALSAPVEVSKELRDRVLAMPVTPNVKPSRLKILRLGKDGSTVRFDAPKIGKFEAVYDQQPAVSAIPTNENASLAVRLSSSELRGSGIELNEGLGHQVPEYLLGYDRSWVRTTLVGALLVIALVVVGVLAIGPVDQLKSMLAIQNPVADPKSIEVSSGNRDEELAKTQAKKDTSIAETKTNQDSEGRVTKGDASDSKPSGDNSASIPQSDMLSRADMPSQDNSSEANATQVVEGNVVEGNNQELALDDKASGLNNPAEANADAVSESVTSTSDAQSNNSMQNGGASKEATVRWLPESKESAESLVIYSNPVDPESQWQKATSGSGLTIGDVIVPAYQRTELVTNEGIRFLVCDASQIECKGAAPIFIPYGKFILFPTPSGNSVNFTTPNGAFKILFQDASSSCAIEVRHMWSETTSEEIANSKLNTRSETKLYGIQGAVGIDWKRDEIAQSADLDVGEVASVVSAESITKTEMESAPAWFRTSVSRSIDQFAWQDAIKFLKKDEAKPLVESLRELSQSRRAETASFAVRVLCQLGRFDSLLGPGGFLPRKGAYTHLQVWLPELPSLLGNKESMEAFVQSVATHLESRTKDVLRLVVTQSGAQLKDGGERLLIESLSSNQQDERLLAIVQLTSLTGKTLGFHPEKNSPEAISQWRKLLIKEESRPSQSN